MSFKDIMNRNIVNLKNCEDEPIHIPGSIQPHGFLFSIDLFTYTITICSSNIGAFIGFSYEQLLGKSINEVFDSILVNEIKSFRDDGNDKVKVFNHTLSGSIFSISIHVVKNQIIVEAEPIKTQFDEGNDLFSSSKQLLKYIEDNYTLKKLAGVVATGIRNITKYDRVMVYRFDKEYNGEVIAESKESNLESYLGLHYPHTDIPVQARELYIKNHLRIIGDVNYEPVPLYKINNSNLETLDLSLSVLRSVSPIHIQYLKNMGVGSTLTISLIHKGKLWGLITCHHNSPKYLSQEIRNTVKLHGHFITSQIDVRLLNEEYEIATQANHSVNLLTSKKLNFDRKSIDKLFEDEAIIKLSNSTGVSAFIDNKIYQFGHTPSQNDCKKLSLYMSNYTDDENFHTDSLARVSDELNFISDEFPGINYYSLNEDTDCIIWYRTQTIKEINWAGDPSKSINKDENGLSPRKSFEIFTENVKDSSRVWLKSELEACENFYYFFEIHLRSIFLSEEKENQRKLTSILEEANAELENINWISTHDLQEPLRKIRMMASMLISDELKTLPNDVQSKIIKMQSSAERMQTLISDILKYTKTNAQSSNFEAVNLNDLFIQIEAELQDSLEENEATLIINDLPTIKGIPFLLKQLFSNIIYNSLKFKNNARLPIIKVNQIFTTENKQIKSDDYFIIEIEDNGIGFENEYKDKIFKIFSRLNNKVDFAGSGIGLALCKKIMNKHYGLITSYGELDKGSRIIMYFPKN